MKKTVLAVISASAMLALSACADEAADDTVIVEDDDGAMAGEGTTVVNEAPEPGTMDTADGDSVSISEDGVQADINDGNTSVNADISDDPSLTVED